MMSYATRLRRSAVSSAASSFGRSAGTMIQGLSMSTFIPLSIAPLMRSIFGFRPDMIITLPAFSLSMRAK